MDKIQSSSVDTLGSIAPQKSFTRYLDSAKLGRIMSKHGSFRLVSKNNPKLQSVDSEPCEQSSDAQLTGSHDSDSTLDRQAQEQSVTSSEDRTSCAQTEGDGNNYWHDVSADEHIIDAPNFSSNASISDSSNADDHGHIYSWYLQLFSSPEFKQDNIVLLLVGVFAITLGVCASGVFGAGAGVVLVGGILSATLGSMGLTASLLHGFFKPSVNACDEDNSELLPQLV